MMVLEEEQLGTGVWELDSWMVLLVFLPDG